MMSTETDPLYWLREHGPKLLAFANQWASCQADAGRCLPGGVRPVLAEQRRWREPLLYLYRCVRNVAIDWARSAKRRQRHEQALGRGQVACPADAPLEQSEMEQSIQEALSKLPTNQREVVVLHLWSDMTFAQIGTILSIPLSTAHAMYRTAMQTLHTEMERLQHE